MPEGGGGGEGLAGSRREHEVEGRVGHAGGDRVGAVDGRNDNDAEPGAGQEGELGGEAVDRAAVAELEFAGAFLHGEAEAVSGGGAGSGELGLPHGFKGLGGEEAEGEASPVASPRSPRLNITSMKRARSSTVEYMLPAGAIPSSKVGASKRPRSNPHIYA